MRMVVGVRRVPVRHQRRGDAVQDGLVRVCMVRSAAGSAAGCLQRGHAAVQVPSQGGRQDPAGLCCVVCRPGAGYRIQAVVGCRRARAGAAAVGHDVAGRGDVPGHGQRVQGVDACGGQRVAGLRGGKQRRHGIPGGHLSRGDGVEDGLVVMRVAVPRSSGSAGAVLQVRHARGQRAMFVQEVPAQSCREDPAGLRRVVCRPGAGYRIQAVVGRRRARAGAAAVGHDVARGGDVPGHGQRVQGVDASGGQGVAGLHGGKQRRHGIPGGHLSRGDGVEDGLVVMRVAVPRSSGSAGYGDVPAPQERRPVDGLDVRAGYQRVLLARDAIQEIPAQSGREDPPGLRRVVCRPGAGYRIQSVV